MEEEVRKWAKALDDSLDGDPKITAEIRATYQLCMRIREVHPCFPKREATRLFKAGKFNQAWATIWYFRR